MRTACFRALAPLARGSFLTPARSGERATVAAARRVSCRGYVTHNPSHDQCRGRRGARPQGQQHGYSASALGSASQAVTGADSSAASSSPHARDAFYVFLRARNAPFGCSGTTAVSQPASDPLSPTAPLYPHPSSHLHPSAHGLGSAARAGAPVEETRCARGGAARHTSSDGTTRRSSSPPPPSLSSRLSAGATPERALEEPRKQQQTPLEAEASRRGASAPPVLGEWSLDPPEASTRRAAAQGGPRSREHRSERDHNDVGTDGDANGSSAQRGRLPDFRERRRRSLQRRGYDALELARRHTSAHIANRRLREYEQTCLHAYRILKQVEWSLAAWARVRRQGQPQDASGRNRSSRSGSAGDGALSAHAAQSMEGQGATGAFRIPPTSEDIDAVDARFFEYAGQIQRTLHQLTPRHFDAVRDYRLRVPSRSSSSSTAATPPSRPRRAEDSTSSAPESLGAAPRQLLLLRLLWRLVHIQQLFFSIGRRASLPRTAVDVYVQSSNCQYGIREVLRVLGSEMARWTLSADTHPHFHSPCGQQWREHDGRAASPSSSVAPLFSNKELFQLFYAVLCIPSEEAPGVPLYDPSIHSTKPRHGGVPDWHAAASASADLPDAALDQFRRDCIATGADDFRMPLDEWCVRWWSHQYSAAGRTGAAGAPPLSMGEAMDVLQACMYATASVQVLATAAPRHTAQQRHHPQQRLVTPFMYFETPPQGATNGARRPRTNAASATASEDNDVVEGAEPSPLRVLDRRYRPQLPGALGGNRMALRIPYHLGQRYVEVFLTYLLSSVSAGPDPREAKEAATMATATVAAGIEHLLRCRDRDAVRDVALLCTAILFFEVFSPTTAAFMACAAPLFREQVELLSGHEISCVLLAYASLQRWERAGGGCGGGASSPASGFSANAEVRAAGRRGGPLDDPAVAVQSASTAAAGRSACGDAWRKGAPRAVAAPEPSPPLHADHQSDATRSSSSSSRAQVSTGPQFPSDEPWHLFYVTLASRAGQLSDTLSEDDVTRVLRAMELTGMEHDDLRHALESSLRMRNMGRRILYEA